MLKAFMVRYVIVAIVASISMAGAGAIVQSDGTIQTEVQEKAHQRLVREEKEDARSVSIEPHGDVLFQEGTDPTTEVDAQDPAGLPRPKLGARLGSAFSSTYPGATDVNVVLPRSADAVIVDGSNKSDTCPWLLGVSTGSDSMLCWNASTCDPSEKGDACCKEAGGVLQCPDHLPFMCQKKSCGQVDGAGGDHCCKAECNLADGGERLCVTGPDGDAGARGVPGPDGKRGHEGHMGVEGHDGHYGKVGPPGEAGPEGKGAWDHAPSKAASTDLLIAVCVVNALLAIGMYVFLKFLKHLNNKKAGAGVSF